MARRRQLPPAIEALPPRIEAALQYLDAMPGHSAAILRRMYEEQAQRGTLEDLPEAH